MIAESVETGPSRTRVGLDCALEPMAVADVEEVLAIERASFRFPWSERAFLSELTLPYAVWRVARMPTGSGQPSAVASPSGRRAASWHLVRKPPRGPLVGYAGLQVILDEGHIMDVAVHPDFRRLGIGELLLLDLYDQVRPRGVLRLTLEVRASNMVAQNLYRKYGFSVEGRRPRYYGDGEDALIMWTGRLDMRETQKQWEELRCRLQRRWAVDDQ
jgi:ribosomal-protein-alanine N-acetyltransferase